jgi:hypothetical protein
MKNIKDSTIPYVSENYTGPYVSDGKFQSSVEFGKAEVKSRLDAMSRLHDSAYAHFKDKQHLQAADEIYSQSAKKLAGAFPEFARDIVKYGNFTARSAANVFDTPSVLLHGLGPIGDVLGLTYGAVKNMFSLNDTLINGDKYKDDVRQYYATDPYSQGKYNPYVKNDPSISWNGGAIENPSIDTAPPLIDGFVDVGQSSLAPITRERGPYVEDLPQTDASLDSPSFGNADNTSHKTQQSSRRIEPIADASDPHQNTESTFGSSTSDYNPDGNSGTYSGVSGNWNFSKLYSYNQMSRKHRKRNKYKKFVYY